MKHVTTRIQVPSRRSPLLRARGAAVALLLAAIPACGGGKATQDATGKLELQSVQLGRLVDVYAFARKDPNVADRRNRLQRELRLVQKNVVINSAIGTDTLFDASGEELPTATYEVRPFRSTVGHEELLILWDDQDPAEQSKFTAALAAAQSGLMELAPSYRGQNTMTRPIPLVARNTAIKLTFSGSVERAKVNGQDYYAVNPAAIQLLEFKGDPNLVLPADAFRILTYRPIAVGNTFIIDTTMLGGESGTGLSVPGLPLSADNVTANIRIAIPSRASASSDLYVREDGVTQLNGVDSAGRQSVIRDFRSGNLSDGTAGRMTELEPPMLVASLGMGVTAVDAEHSIVQVDKRNHFVPVRGRYPFVDGPLETTDGPPAGPFSVPISRPLRSGDYLTQRIQVQLPTGDYEFVDLEAEILQNMEVGTVLGDTTLPTLGRVENQLGGTNQGEMVPVVRLRLSSLVGGYDSMGNPHQFQASAAAGGRDCVVRARYIERVAFSGGGSDAVSDANWRTRFVKLDPTPTGVTPGTLVDTNATLALEFSKPLDLDQVDNSANFVITDTASTTETFDVQMGTPKKATLRLVPTRLSDLTGDGTRLRLQPPMGFFHAQGVAEDYAVHLKLGSGGITDLAGNSLDIFGNLANPETSWSADFSLAPTQASNLVGWHSWIFEAEDEDGSLPGSVDMFGQFRLENGRLLGATGVRFSRNADNQNMQSISRIHRGECWDSDFDPINGSPQGLPTPQTAPSDGQGAPHPGLLYWQPKMFDQIAPPAVPAVYEYNTILPQNVGRVVEPLHPNGSRLQMRYLEDDFSLSYTQPSEFGLDIEQMYWSPFNDETIYYDVFDRYSLSLSHTGKRADVRFTVIPGDATAMPIVLPGCQFNCPSMNSGLSSVFTENVLPGTSAVPVFTDRVYTINPNSAFRSGVGVKYLSFPRFDRSYTWRDSRLVTVDGAGNVIGLGGAAQPTAPAPNNDSTANIDSPWITSAMDPDFVTAGGSVWVVDEADFVGDALHDHDPIALPLLLDFMMFPDSSANGIAAGINNHQVAMMGPPSFGFPAIPGGYYDRQAAGCNGTPPWPRSRVQATGGEDLLTQGILLVDPANTLRAQVSYLKDAGLGNATRAIFAAPEGDGMVHWAQADFVRKVSTVTFGFFDTLRPQRAQLVSYDGAGVPTVNNTFGFPDLFAVNPNLRISDMLMQIDPPQSRQPAGTSVVIELRGAEDFENSDAMYNPTFAQAGQTANDEYDNRGNLLNVNYSAEAYRYSQLNQLGNVARVSATNLTKYVTEDQIGQLRDGATGLLPRFFNPRLVLTNNVDVSPALSPSLRSMSTVYRLLPLP